ncbi:MAG TPA: hypothetical protein DF712_22685 [Balneola sp.]|jgi:DNA-binding NarL/FixJ family response regulator|nr:hypothetical protein [Bacteroidota bacterium]MAC05625.1 hypothetical protein [Balneola sp.]MAO77342.1 hypothetical protein [Balneola sp.]MBF65446.1 hypothetical protein [Balneola sp.]HAH51342.1 hypothetical protein [Balneola sp.]|tara:strand:- start:1732 stop:2091 length:360 start_codon:yes stop_codon:yes gene_type:complete
MKIMIVEDHEGMRQLLKSMILSHFKDSIVIIECENGERAIEKFPKNKPDLVLMDIEMGELDGFQTTEIIHSTYPEAKIIFVSSNDSTEFRKKAKKLNALDFVSKETLSDIYEVVEKNLA